MSNSNQPKESPAGLASDQYRTLMREHAAAVAIVATGAASARVGLTATSVSSLSASPPQLLVCVGQTTQAHQAITDNGFFSVNFLSEPQHELAEVFAGRRGVSGSDRFKHATWTELSTGAPVLQDAIANLDCELQESHHFTTHSIFVGRVIAGRHDDSTTPLLYFRGQYRNLADRA